MWHIHSLAVQLAIFLLEIMPSTFKVMVLDKTYLIIERVLIEAVRNDRCMTPLKRVNMTQKSTIVN